MPSDELSYYKRKLDSLSGENINMQYIIASMSNQITQLQNGYQIMWDVTSRFYQNKDLNVLFEYATNEMTTRLYLEKGLVLKRQNRHGLYHVIFESGNKKTINKEIQLSPEANNWMLHNDLLIVNSNSLKNEIIEEISEFSGLPYFILRPFNILQDQYVFLGGRMKEHKRFTYAPLSESDGFVFTAVTNMISNLAVILTRENLIEKERERIARDMHDNIGSELSNISLWSELLIREQLKKQKSYHEKIRGSIKEVVDNLGNTVWMLNSRNNSLKNLIGYVREYAGKYLETRSIMFNLIEPESSTDIIITHETRHNLFMIIKEALFNTSKYAKASHVNIEIKANENLLVEIWDNGQGFSETRKFGNGLLNIQKRTEEMNGVFTIQSSPETGTKITIVIPAYNMKQS